MDYVIPEIKSVNPKLLVPSHSTGWGATLRCAQKLPNAFV